MKSTSKVSTCLRLAGAVEGHAPQGPGDFPGPYSSLNPRMTVGQSSANRCTSTKSSTAAVKLMPA